MNDRSSLGVKPDSFYSERMSKLNTPSGDSLVSGGIYPFLVAHSSNEVNFWLRIQSHVPQNWAHLRLVMPELIYCWFHHFSL